MLGGTAGVWPPLVFQVAWHSVVHVVCLPLFAVAIASQIVWFQAERLSPATSGSLARADQPRATSNCDLISSMRSARVFFSAFLSGSYQTGSPALPSGSARGNSPSRTDLSFKRRGKGLLFGGSLYSFSLAWP